MQEARHDPAAVRARLARYGGARRQWRSVDERAGDSPDPTPPPPPGVDRRTFLKLAGASIALAGLSGCAIRPPREKIIPYVRQPEVVVPGKPLFFATAVTLGGYATGVLVESHEGRPTRVEGNPQHPASLGASDPLTQAAILEFYHPERARHVTQRGNIRTWQDFHAEFTGRLQAQQASGGAGLRVLSETIPSPTLAAQLAALLDAFPQARWHPYAPVARDTVLAGTRLAFGEPLNPIYRFDRANIILALDADFLTRLPGHLRYAHDWMERRRVRAGQTEMNRLYVVESTPTNTGAMADHRQPLRASQIDAFTRAVARAVGVDLPADALPEGAAWFDALVRDLQANRGASLVLAGDEQPPAVHAMAHAINGALGNIGTTVSYTPPIEANPANATESLRELVEAMAGGEVEMLLILGGNPAYDAPADLPFGDLLARVPVTTHLSTFYNETSARCGWHLPQQHELETWSDARAFDGTASILQPLIAPLYEDSRSAHALLAALLGDDRSDYEIVRDHWAQQGLTADFERFWRRALHDGVIEGSAPDPVQPTLQPDLADRLPAGPPPGPTPEGLELIFRPDPTIWDGRFAHNPWLQELPKPLTKLTWDNAALLSPATAAELGLATEELVELHYRGRVVRAPVFVLPGHADGSVTLSLGYGRPLVDEVVGSEGGMDEPTNTRGVNAYRLRTSDAPWVGSGLEIRRLGTRYPLATTQGHHRMEGRDPVRVGTIQRFRETPDFVQEGTPSPPFPSLLPEQEADRYEWGMTIDLTACIGCNACVIACQAENNIPTVGKEEVARGREMHWLRVDRYYEGDASTPQTYFQPVPCMHCEKAPCEVVCPVEATVHSEEGLNEMVYDRCVGTRYCSNNCPYKVRRFNFLQYVEDIPILQELRNPDVSVRPVGVMEKCTYCVQRINAARIEAKKEQRPIRDGEVVPACAAACPTRAIEFGDISDPNTSVARLKAQPHHYGLLAELGTQPRTTYLARLWNPNPEA